MNGSASIQSYTKQYVFIFIINESHVALLNELNLLHFKLIKMNSDLANPSEL